MTKVAASALVLIFPIPPNIFFINAIHLPGGLPIAIALFPRILFLACARRENQRPLLAAK